MPSASRPKPANGPALGRLMKSLTSLSVMPWCGSQSSGQSAGSMLKSFGPLYLPSMRPYWPPPAAAEPAVEPSVAVPVVASLPPAVPVVASDPPAVVAVVAPVAPPVVAGAPVDAVLSSSPPQAASTSAAVQASATEALKLRLLIFPLFGVLLVRSGQVRTLASGTSVGSSISTTCPVSASTSASHDGCGITCTNRARRR